MISLKVLSTAAVMALVLPMVAPAPSFAQQQHPEARTGNVRPGGGTPGPRFNGAPGPRYNGGGAPGPRYSGGGYRRDGGYIPGAVAGAVAAGVVAGYPGYYAPGYYDDGYDDDAAVAVVPGPAGGDDDAVAYCMQTYRSYDPASGTYMGNDGLRHPCP